MMGHYKLNRYVFPTIFLGLLLLVGYASFLLPKSQFPENYNSFGKKQIHVQKYLFFPDTDNLSFPENNALINNFTLSENDPIFVLGNNDILQSYFQTRYYQLRFLRNSTEVHLDKNKLFTISVNGQSQLGIFYTLNGIDVYERLDAELNNVSFTLLKDRQSFNSPDKIWVNDLNHDGSTEFVVNINSSLRIFDYDLNLLNSSPIMTGGLTTNITNIVGFPGITPKFLVQFAYFNTSTNNDMDLLPPTYLFCELNEFALGNCLTYDQYVDLTILSDPLFYRNSYYRLVQLIRRDNNKRLELGMLFPNGTIIPYFRNIQLEQIIRSLFQTKVNYRLIPDVYFTGSGELETLVIAKNEIFLVSNHTFLSIPLLNNFVISSPPLILTDINDDGFNELVIADSALVTVLTRNLVTYAFEIPHHEGIVINYWSNDSFIQFLNEVPGRSIENENPLKFVGFMSITVDLKTERPYEFTPNLLLGFQIPDTLLIDQDRDGLLAIQENYFKSDDTLLDSDNDTFTDLQEFQFGGVSNYSDVGVDKDQDGYTFEEELNLGMNDLNRDCNINFIPDNEENNFHLFPKSSNLDPDNDGLNSNEEIILGLDPLDPDTDGDSINDGLEMNLFLDPHTSIYLQFFPLLIFIGYILISFIFYYYLYLPHIKTKRSVKIRSISLLRSALASETLSPEMVIRILRSIIVELVSIKDRRPHWLILLPLLPAFAIMSTITQTDPMDDPIQQNFIQLKVLASISTAEYLNTRCKNLYGIIETISSHPIYKNNSNIELLKRLLDQLAGKLEQMEVKPLK
ncbi:MAG: hypothetical protein D6732_07075 [Methanobacteriota archaeon]|nr:MAG: hypothetical protein D6732_07075 [Euryarchaeota archaeon]